VFFPYLHYCISQYIYTYTTTTTLMRDLSSCSVCKFLVMVTLQVFGAGCCPFYCHYECTDSLVFRLSVLYVVICNNVNREKTHNLQGSLKMAK
jgi:hypothetical protein